MSRDRASLDRSRAISLILALLVGAAAVWLIAYAVEPDPYYATGDVSRWEHARDWGGWWVFLAAVSLAAVSSLAHFARALGWRGSSELLVVLTVGALGALLIAWVAISVGH